MKSAEMLEKLLNIEQKEKSYKRLNDFLDLLIINGMSIPEANKEIERRDKAESESKKAKAWFSTKEQLGANKPNNDDDFSEFFRLVIGNGMTTSEAMGEIRKQKKNEATKSSFTKAPTHSGSYTTLATEDHENMVKEIKSLKEQLGTTNPVECKKCADLKNELKITRFDNETCHKWNDQHLLRINELKEQLGTLELVNDVLVEENRLLRKHNVELAKKVSDNPKSYLRFTITPL